MEDKKAWQMATRRKRVMEDDAWENKFFPLSYRPFDVRWIFYHEDLIERARSEVMQHMLEPNLALMTCRQLSQPPWHHVMVTDRITDDCMVSNKTRERGYLLPLYLYPKDLFATGKRANLNPSVLNALKEHYHHEMSAEEIFSYIYAVLYAPTYRRKYIEFLKSAFPRIPFTRERDLFTKLAALGSKLVDLHLLKSPELEKPICRFQGKGDNRVEKQSHNPKEKRVYINNAQYFENVEADVWKYQVGGYQVLEKWLKDRKTRILSTEDIKHYCRVVTAFDKTIKIQREIDELYPQVEKDVVTIAS